MAHPGPTALEAVLDLPTQAEFQRTVPTDWRGLFIRQYTDAGVYSGLLPVSRTTRDWVLQTAPEATMSLPVPAPSAQLAAVSQALATRGDRPTSLRVSCQDGLLDAAAPLLAGLSGSSIQALQVMPEQYADPPSATALTTFLQHAGSALPALASLHLDLPCILPPPEHLPQITHLHVTLDALDPTARAITITPYLTQLTSLSVAEPNIQYRPWPDIFTQKAPKLRDLSTSGPIQNGLISRLIDHAPRLKTLQARRLDLRGPRVEKWAVESVGVDNGFQLDALAGLPGLYKGAEDGERERCGVRGEYCGVAVSHAEGLDADLVTRLSQFEILTDTMYIQPGHLLLEADHTRALQAALTQLRDLQVPNAIIELRNWDLPPHTLTSITPQLQPLTHLRFSLNLTPTNPLHQPTSNNPETNREALTDPLLHALLQMPHNVSEVVVSGLGLVSGEQASVAWPWERVRVMRVNVGMVGLLPDPGLWRGRGRACVRFDTLDFSQITQVNMTELSARVRHIDWARGWPQLQSTVMLSAPKLPNGDSDPHAESHLLTQISLLQTMRFTKKSDQDRQVSVSIAGPLTHSVMQALQGLPSFTGELILTECTWPLEVSQYTQLAQYVPTSFTGWGLTGTGVGQGRLQCVCEGISQRRAGLGLPCVKVRQSVGWQAVPECEGVSLVYEPVFKPFSFG